MAAAAGMMLLGLLQAGGSVLGQAMEKVTGGNLLSMLLIACAFTLSLVYLFRLAAGHLVQLPAGAVRTFFRVRVGRAPQLRRPKGWRGRLRGPDRLSALAGRQLGATAAILGVAVVAGALGAGVVAAAAALPLVALAVAPAVTL